MVDSRYCLRRFRSADQLVAREIYVDAIESQAGVLYSSEQIAAWKVLAWLPGVLDRTFSEGHGWVMTSEDQVEAFAMRHPADRLALLYCRGRSSRQGLATALLQQVEQEAKADGLKQLVADASLISQPLLLRHGWIMRCSESIEIGGVPFVRYLMSKDLQVIS